MIMGWISLRSVYVWYNNNNINNIIIQNIIENAARINIYTTETTARERGIY